MKNELEKIRREAARASLLYFKQEITALGNTAEKETAEYVERFGRLRRQYVSFLIDLATVNECDYALGKHYGGEVYEALYKRLDREIAKELEKVQKTHDQAVLAESLYNTIKIFFPIWIEMRTKGAY